MRDRSREKQRSDGLVALLSVTLDRDTTESLVMQLYRHLRELILERRLAAGSKLPSTRRLSRDLDVSRTVTLDAFGQLVADGFLESRRGAGHFVPTLPVAISPESLLANEVHSEKLEVSTWSPTGNPFDPSWQAVELFPAQVWSRMLGRGWRRHQAAALERHWNGLPVLRELLAKHLLALRGLVLTPDQVMITAGHADVLDLIARALPSLSANPAVAWVENPGLISARQSLNRAGVATVPIPVDAEGLRVIDGEQTAPDAAMALVTPTRQFPLGMPLALSRRLSLLDWARRSRAVIVEDDYDGEIRFAGRPLGSLASLDPTARVLTTGSFSKLTFPGMRLGYVAGSAELIGKLKELRRQDRILVPTAGQAAFAEFIGTGAFSRHLRSLRLHLKRRRSHLVDSLRSQVAELVEVLPQEVGMHLTVRLTPWLAARVTDVELAQRSQGDLVLLPLSEQYTDGRGESGFMLGYAGWTDLEMRAAIDRFVALLREATKC